MENSKKSLFGGAIKAYIPVKFQDARYDCYHLHSRLLLPPIHVIKINKFAFVQLSSDIRSVPSNQEVFLDLNTFDNDAENNSIIQGIVPLTSASDIPLLGTSDVQAYFLNGQQVVTKFNEDNPNARNQINVFMTLIRLFAHKTDIVIHYNVPFSIGEGSSSKNTAIAIENDATVALEEFKKVVSSFEILDWSLFGN
ncbi:2885_t:CDS:2 [Entrophospora sp. SA101]|nr:8122_t:CDS:2 [Entrophospora sp. SA101]CAJ0766585.1 2885_t:CDS:2 [Entrophospora sp. SA101]